MFTVDLWKQPGFSIPLARRLCPEHGASTTTTSNAPEARAASLATSMRWVKAGMPAPLQVVAQNPQALADNFVGEQNAWLERQVAEHRLSTRRRADIEHPR